MLSDHETMVLNMEVKVVDVDLCLGVDIIRFMVGMMMDMMM